MLEEPGTLGVNAGGELADGGQPLLVGAAGRNGLGEQALRVEVQRLPPVTDTIENGPGPCPASANGTQGWPFASNSCRS